MAQLILFAAGAVLGTALDQLHVASGATSYARPFWLGQAAWVPLLFGFAAAGFADLHRRLRLASGAAPRRSGRLAAIDLLIFALAYGASAYLPISNPSLLLIFAFVFLVRAGLVDEPLHRFAHALLCALLGVAGEWLLTGLGAFTHHRADVLRVPYWLPGLYLLAAPLLADLDDLLAPGTPAEALAAAHFESLP